MKKRILRFILSIWKVSQLELIDIHDEATYGKAYMEYLKKYREYVYGTSSKPTEKISTEWHDSPSLSKLRTIKITKDLLNEK